MRQLLLVDYHYVRAPNAYQHPGIHPISPEAFAAQIEKLAAHFHIATPEEVEAFVAGGKDLPRDSALITFDDGLVDHAETARNILDPLGVKAVFFVCTRPLKERRAVTVHKVHWLRATTEPAEFRNELLAALGDSDSVLSDENRARAHKLYRYDTPRDAEIKYLLNFRLPENLVDRITRDMLKRRGISEEEFCRRTYMDAQALRALTDAGHAVGAHTHDHTPVTHLGVSENDSMALNIHLIEQATRVRPRWFSYPYGREDALPEDSGAFCRRHGFSVGVTLRGTWVQPAHMPYALDRINTNEVDQVLSARHAPVG